MKVSPCPFKPFQESDTMNNPKDKTVYVDRRKAVGYGLLAALSCILVGFLYGFTRSSVNEQFGDESPTAQIFFWVMTLTTLLTIISFIAIFVVKIRKELSIGR